MCVGQSQIYMISSIAEQRRQDIVRSADQDRILREAGIPTAVDSIRLTLGRGVVGLGKLIAGRRSWSQEPLPGASAALNLAR